MVALGLACCVWAFSGCGEQGPLFTVVQWLLVAVASLVAEHRLQGMQASGIAARGLGSCSPGLKSAGSVALAHGLSCSEACGIFPEQGSNPRPLRLLPSQADSLPPSHHGSLHRDLDLTQVWLLGLFSFLI